MHLEWEKVPDVDDEVSGRDGLVREEQGTETEGGEPQ